MRKKVGASKSEKIGAKIGSRFHCPLWSENVQQWSPASRSTLCNWVQCRMIDRWRNNATKDVPCSRQWSVSRVLCQGAATTLLARSPTVSLNPAIWYLGPRQLRYFSSRRYNYRNYSASLRLSSCENAAVARTNLLDEMEKSARILT